MGQGFSKLQAVTVRLKKSLIDLWQFFAKGKQASTHVSGFLAFPGNCKIYEQHSQKSRSAERKGKNKSKSKSELHDSPRRAHDEPFPQDFSKLAARFRHAEPSRTGLLHTWAASAPSQPPVPESSPAQAAPPPAAVSLSWIGDNAQMNDAADQQRGLPSTDAALVEACRRNDSGAWARLVKRFERLIFTVPRRAGLSQDEAADVFQNVFMRLHEHLGSLQQTDRLQAWLVTTARRETLRHLEQRKRFPGQMPSVKEGEDADAYALEEVLVDPDPLPDELLDDLQQRHRARLALESLGDPCAGLLRLLYMTEEPVPYADISVQLGMPLGSIGPTRARCLGKLRERLGG